MGTISIRVDQSLAEILEKVRCEIAGNIKNTYGLDEVTINGTLTSKVAAAKMRGDKLLRFKIKKSGYNKGIIELI